MDNTLGSDNAADSRDLTLQFVIHQSPANANRFEVSDQEGHYNGDLLIMYEYNAPPIPSIQFNLIDISTLLVGNTG